MQPRIRTGLVTTLFVVAVVVAACGKDTPPRGGGGGERAAMPAGDPAAMTERPSSPMASPRTTPQPREVERPRGERQTSAGPTGLVECDQALEMVCRCAKAQPSLQRPCRTLEEDAPAWKGRAKEAVPGQIEDLRKACRRILTSVQEAYGCK